MVYAQPRQQLACVARLRVEACFISDNCRNDFKRFGKARIVCVLTARPIRVQNKLRFPIIHLIPPFCLIGKQRLYSREAPLLRAAAGATALSRATIATSPCRSARRAYLRFPDTKIVPDKTASVARETALPLRANPAALSRCRTCSHSV